MKFRKPTTTSAPVKPNAGGLWRTMTQADGSINPGAWTKAEENGDIVGVCRACGGFMTVDTPTTTYGADSMVWRYARCLACGRECVSPNGRTLRKSGRASERPNQR
jgi:hypothetical protein